MDVRAMARWRDGAVDASAPGVVTSGPLRCIGAGAGAGSSHQLAVLLTHPDRNTRRTIPRLGRH